MAGVVDPRLREGIAAAHARRLDEARVLLQEAVTATPDSALGWFWLAVVATTADAAISHLRRSLALDPSQQAARQALAKLLLAQASRMAKSDIPGARALADECAGLAPEIEAVWLAVASLAEDRPVRLNALQRAYAINQTDTTRDRLRQTLLHEAVSAASRDRASARRLFREAATLGPEDARIWRALVQLADSAPEALATVRDLVALAPNFPIGRVYLHDAVVADARLQAASGDRATARDRWREAASLDARDLEAWLGLAESTVDEAEARLALDSAFAIDPHDARVLEARARISSVAADEVRPAADETTADPWSDFALSADPFARFAAAPVSTQADAALPAGGAPAMPVVAETIEAPVPAPSSS
jgi:tetratricopeptide (TPR) repeat protein